MIALAPRHGFSALLLAVTLGGCTTDSGRYPSLAIRDHERVIGSFEAVDAEGALEPPAPASETTVEEAARLVALARKEYQSFVELAPEVERQLIAMRMMGPQDDDWAKGQLAFAELDTRRSQLAVLLGDLDLMFADASLSYQQLDEVDGAREAVRQLVTEADLILARLATSGG